MHEVGEHSQVSQAMNLHMLHIVYTLYWSLWLYLLFTLFLYHFGLFWSLPVCLGRKKLRSKITITWEQLAQQAKQVDDLKLIPTHNDLLSTFFCWLSSLHKYIYIYAPVQNHQNHGTLLHFWALNLLLKWDFQDSNIFNRSTRGWSLGKGFLLTGFHPSNCRRSLQVQIWWIWSLISHAFMAMAPWLPELNPQDVSKRVTNVETWEAEGWRWRCDTTKNRGDQKMTVLWIYSS